MTTCGGKSEAAFVYEIAFPHYSYVKISNWIVCISAGSEAAVFFARKHSLAITTYTITI